MTTELPNDPNGFGGFFRQYTRSWVHAVATAGLTAFGTLTFLNRWFAVLAISSYLLPPIALYARNRQMESEGKPDVERTDAENERSGQEVGEAERADPDRGTGPADEPASVPDPADERMPTSDAGLAEDSVDSDLGEGMAESADERSEREERAESESQPEPATWEVAETPTEATFRDAAVSSGRVYAAGDGGIVLAGGREGASGEEWSVILKDGPGATSEDLHGIDATDDGAAVWVAGDGGALGRIDAETGRHADHSAPDGRTDNLAGIAVSGPAGEETILAIDGSGAVLRGRYDGSEARWEGPVTLGSGSSLSGIVLEDEVGYCCDTNDSVFETADRGGSFEAIGPVGASGTLVVIAVSPEGPLVGSDDGVLYRFGGSNWTPERVADSLAGLACHGKRTVVCTKSDVFERAGPGADWERADPIGAEGLRAVAVGPDWALAVGENGTIVERLGTLSE